MLFLSPKWSDLPAPLVTVSGVSNGRVGEQLTLTCEMSTVKHLISSTLLTLQWRGGRVGTRGVIMSDTTHSGNTSKTTLTFTPLNTSHGGEYSCNAKISIPVINLTKEASERTALNVQSKRLCALLLIFIRYMYSL